LLAIVDNRYAAYLAGPAQITDTTSWQRFKLTGTLASGQTGLWIVVRHYTANRDDWTTDDIHFGDACLQQGDNPQAAYTRTWASQTTHLPTRVAAGPTIFAGPDNTISPHKVAGAGSNLTDSTLLELTANGELTLAGPSGNGYRLAELMSTSNPSGWADVLKAETQLGLPSGTSCCTQIHEDSTQPRLKRRNVAPTAPRHTGHCDRSLSSVSWQLQEVSMGNSENRRFLFLESRTLNLLLASSALSLAVIVNAAPATPANPSPGSPSSPGPTTAGSSVTLSWSASSGEVRPVEGDRASWDYPIPNRRL
jgi:hypothetical protein